MNHINHRRAILTIALLLISVGCQRSSGNRIFIDFDSPPPGVTIGTVVLMNGVSIGMAENAIVVQLEKPKVRVPVTLMRNIETLPSETIFHVTNEAGTRVIVGEPQGNHALPVSRSNPLVFAGAATDVELLRLRARHFVNELLR
jgi:hypothetical protein